MMDNSRNQYFLMGMVLLLLGIQFLLTDTFVLNPQVTAFLAEKTNHPAAALGATTAALAPNSEPTATKTIKPPDFVGYLLSSLGVVLILHSWGMKKSG